MYSVDQRIDSLDAFCKGLIVDIIPLLISFDSCNQVTVTSLVLSEDSSWGAHTLVVLLGKTRYLAACAPAL